LLDVFVGVAVEIALHESATDVRDVLDPLPERRDADHDAGQTLVEVAPECPPIHLGFEVAVRRRHVADPDVLADVGADRRHLVGLDDA
jgi:hypothetical protein